jgi:triosephosphate isomerase
MTEQKKKILVVNWKTGCPEGGVDNWVGAVSQIAENTDNIKIVVCPGAKLFIETQTAIEKYGNRIELGVQDLTPPEELDKYEDIPGSFA